MSNRTKENLTRRSFLSALSSVVGAVAIPSLLVACRSSSSPRGSGLLVSDASRVVTPYGTPASNANANANANAAGDACVNGIATEANIEGPYYRDGAPFRTDLTAPGIVGSSLILTGSVVSLDCRSPLRDAVLDVWQADGEGRYDNDGSFGRRESSPSMRLRGKVRVASNGAFSIRSVIPGRYLNGSTYRPAHVHVKVTAPGHLPLTTQLYFPDDPYNKVDPFIRKSLIMDVARNGSNGGMGHYDFVLTPLPPPNARAYG